MATVCHLPEKFLPVLPVTMVFWDSVLRPLGPWAAGRARGWGIFSRIPRARMIFCLKTRDAIWDWIQWGFSYWIATQSERDLLSQQQQQPKGLNGGGKGTITLNWVHPPVCPPWPSLSLSRRMFYKICSQRKLQIGYNRAARIIDMMEAEGIVSKANHVGKRDVL